MLSPPKFADPDALPPPSDPKDEASRPKRSRPLFCNAQRGPKEIRTYCALSETVTGLLRAAIQQLGLSARTDDRLQKVARTIADLGGERDIQVAHVAEAIQYRSLERKFWSR